MSNYIEIICFFTHFAFMTLLTESLFGYYSGLRITDFYFFYNQPNKEMILRRGTLNRLNKCV